MQSVATVSCHVEDITWQFYSHAEGSLVNGKQGHHSKGIN